MGSFYANIHLRTGEQEAVERAWVAYWAERGETSWAFVSPLYHHWITVFDWRCDQMETDRLTELAAHLSRNTACTGLAFQVQDSALAEYWLFDHGNTVDHYTSNSEYFANYTEPPFTAPGEGIYDGFGPDSGAGYPVNEDLSDGGNLRLLRSLTGTSAGEMELEAILRSPAVIADDILTALASILGINDIWASLGYHYLTTESDTIIGFDSFRHLPPGQPPNLAHRPEKDS